MAGKLLSETVQDSFVREFSKANRTTQNLGRTFFEKLGWAGSQKPSGEVAKKTATRKRAKK